MKTALLILSAASMMSGEAVSPPQACPAPSASQERSSHTRFDPIMVDLDGKRNAAGAPQTCSHAINTQGTGAAGRAASADHAINTKGTGAAERAAAADHAINTKGTGTSGRAATAGPGGDCDDRDDGRDSRFAPRESLPVADAEQSAKLAIKCKGTSAK